jgi:ribosomal protein S3
VGQKTHPNGFRLVLNQYHLSSWYASKKNYSLLAQEDYQLRTELLKELEPFLTISKIKILRISNNPKEKELVSIFISCKHPRQKEMIKKLSELISYFELEPSKKNFDDDLENDNLSDSEIRTQNFLKNYFQIRKENLDIAKEKIQKYFLSTLKYKSQIVLDNFQKQTNKIYKIKFFFIKSKYRSSTLIAKFIKQKLQKRIPFRRIIKKILTKVKNIKLIQGIKIELSGRLNGIEIARSEWKREGRIPLQTLSAKIDYTHEKANTIYGIIGIKVWLFKKSKKNVKLVNSQNLKLKKNY